MKDRNINHSDNWETPNWLYDELDDEFHFDFDPCPLDHDMSWDGLEIEWGSSNFMNPPYDRKLKPLFVKKAIHEFSKGKTCVCLLPVSTSTKIFHDFILPNITEPIRFLRGRVSFEGINTKGEFVKNKKGMHDTMVVIFDGKR